MNPELDHPLMHIKNLDESPKRSKGRRSQRRRSRMKRSIRSRLLPSSLYNQPRRYSSTMQTRYQKRISDKMFTLKLSESESESKSESESESKPESEDDEAEQSPKYRESLRTTTRASANDLLEHDLYLSSDSSDSSSATTGISSDNESNASKENTSKVEYLCEGQNEYMKLPQAYFFIKKMAGKSVLEDFINTSLTGDPETVLMKFTLVCRDYPIERAGALFANKLKSHNFKKCLNLVGIYYPLFKTCVLGAEKCSKTVFGRIVMTLIFHWRSENVVVAGKLLTLLSSKFIKAERSYYDILSLRPYGELDRNAPGQRNAPTVASVCCEIYFTTGDVEQCLKLLLRSLTSVPAVKSMKPLIVRVLSEWMVKRRTTALMGLFNHILRIQGNGESPIDLAAMYDRVMSVHVVSCERSDILAALDLFEKVKRNYYFQPARLPCRGLLITAALKKEPRSRIHRIFSMCVNRGAYPSFKFERSTIQLFSSMTKIEIQLYLDEYVRGYMKLVWAKSLLLRPILKFEILVDSGAPARDYVYPVLRQILEVDCSREGVLRRLDLVIQYNFNTPADLVVKKSGNTILMLDSVVLELFKKILKVDSLKEHCSGPGCPFCDFV